MAVFWEVSEDVGIEVDLWVGRGGLERAAHNVTLADRGSDGCGGLQLGQAAFEREGRGRRKRRGAPVQQSQHCSHCLSQTAPPTFVYVVRVRRIAYFVLKTAFLRVSCDTVKQENDGCVNVVKR